MNLVRRVVPMVYSTGEQVISSSVRSVAHIISNKMKETNDSEIMETENQIPSNSTEYLVHNKLEAIFNWIQPLILWHNPVKSILFLVIYHYLNRLFIAIVPNFFATVMTALFVYNATIYWFRYIWPEIRVPVPVEREIESKLDVDRWTPLHPDLITLKEFGLYADNLIKLLSNQSQKLIEFRRTKPAIFCASVCLFFSCTACIGRVNNLIIFFDAILYLFIYIGIYKCILPNCAQVFMRQHCYPASNETNESNDDDHDDDDKEEEEEEKEEEGGNEARDSAEGSGKLILESQSDNVSRIGIDPKIVEKKEKLEKSSSKEVDEEDHDFVLL